MRRVRVVRVRELKQQSFAHTGKEDYNYFLTVIFPDSQVRILAYNRTVQDLNGTLAGRVSRRDS